MIEIQLYCQEVGIFSGGKYHSIKYFSKHAVNSDRNCKHDKHLGNAFLWISFSQFACSINSTIEFIAFKCNNYKSWKLSGDTELNPGPYEIIKTLHGSFNQGNVALLGETAGRRYTCNALFSICWSVVCDIRNWKSVDLDYVLVEEYKLYKLLKCHDYLNVDQLPRQVKIFQRSVNLDISEENLHDSIAVYRDSFLTDVFTVLNVNTSSGCILFLCSYAVALFRYVNGRG